MCRLTVKGGLPAATFREVAAEAGVSVRLVQYYFGSKSELLLATQRHVAQRAVERLRAHVQALPVRTPRHELQAILGSFIPVDDESREHMLVFIALGTAWLVEPALARAEASDVPNSLAEAVRALLERSRLRSGVDPRLEASLLVAAVPSLAQGVLDGTFTPPQAFAVLDYALGRVFRA